MKYTIVFPIPVSQKDEFTYLIPTGLYRDVATQLKFTTVRMLCMTGTNPLDPDMVEVDMRKHPKLSVRLLPYKGGLKSALMNYSRLWSILSEEAYHSDVWHTGCSISMWDLSRLGYQVGRRHAAGLRVYCLDSDPVSMLRESGRWGNLRAGRVWRTTLQRIKECDLTILNGQGVVKTYAPYTKRHVVTDACWLFDGDLADEGETRVKFAQPGPVRIALPSRLMPWKGVDDSINALALLGDRVGDYVLDVIGEGPEKKRLIGLCKEHELDNRVRFHPQIPYGEPFFRYLRRNHVVLVPTRGLEDVRIAYDAAASGCVILHSKTETLQNSAGKLPKTWSFEPGNPLSLSEVLAEAFTQRGLWGEAALDGIRSMRGRTMESWHRCRHEAIEKLWQSRCREQALKSPVTPGGPG